MVDAIPKTCVECGKQVLELGHHLKGSYRLSDPDDLMSAYTCEECYAERWDKGFESSMDYSDEMILREKNEAFAQEEVDPRDIRYMVAAESGGAWRCLACGRLRVDEEQTRYIPFDQEAETKRREGLVEALDAPCRHCGAKGQFVYEP